MIIRADARSLPLVDGCVDCVITSPPYFGLRDYGHAGQIGLEQSPAEYVAALVAVFADVRRVLKDTGTVWCNLGDSYAAQRGGTQMSAETLAGGAGGYEQDGQGHRGRGTLARADVVDYPSGEPHQTRVAHRDAAAIGLKHKDLMGIPWRVAFALQADGWYLRSDIIWSKPNPMPESVTDRPTKAHEYLFLLAKSERYFFDADAIREVSVTQDTRRPYTSEGAWQMDGRPVEQRRGGQQREYVKPYTGTATKDYAAGGAQDPSAVKARIVDKILAGGLVGRNRRSVWEIPTQPYAGAHFATMPEALVEPCVLAGCPLGGLVLDPFLGSGTVGAVAERLGRRWVGTDLSYQPLAKKRTAQRGIRFDVA